MPPHYAALDTPKTVGIIETAVAACKQTRVSRLLQAKVGALLLQLLSRCGALKCMTFCVSHAVGTPPIVRVPLTRDNAASS